MASEGSGAEQGVLGNTERAEDRKCPTARLLSVVWGTATAASPRGLPEVQNLQPCPGLLNQMLRVDFIPSDPCEYENLRNAGLEVSRPLGLWDVSLTKRNTSRHAWELDIIPEETRTNTL